MTELKSGTNEKEEISIIQLCPWTPETQDKKIHFHTWIIHYRHHAINYHNGCIATALHHVLWLIHFVFWWHVIELNVNYSTALLLFFIIFSWIVLYIYMLLETFYWWKKLFSSHLTKRHDILMMRLTHWGLVMHVHFSGQQISASATEKIPTWYISQFYLSYSIPYAAKLTSL